MTISRYIGVPYVVGGYSFAGADCFGVVQLYYRNELGIELARPSVYAHPYQRMRMALDHYRALGFELLPENEPTPGDVVLLQHGSVPDTFGVVMQDGKVLTTSIPTGSVLTALNRDRIVAVFRRGGAACA